MLTLMALYVTIIPVLLVISAACKLYILLLQMRKGMQRHVHSRGKPYIKTKNQLLLIALILVGCAPVKPMPPGSAANTKTRAKAMAVKTWSGVVKVHWNNSVYTNLAAYSVIEASEDLNQWTEVWRGPYAETNLVTLTNQPAFRFYRVYNALK